MYIMSLDWNIKKIIFKKLDIFIDLYIQYRLYVLFHIANNNENQKPKVNEK